MVITEATQPNPSNPSLGNEFQCQFVHNEASGNGRSFVLLEHIKESSKEVRIQNISEERSQCKENQAEKNKGSFAFEYNYEIEEQNQTPE